MTRTCAACLALALSVSSASAGETWIQSEVNGHWYAGTNLMFLRDDAKAYAESFGGHLATVRSEAEHQWLLSKFVGTFEEWWIGFSDAETEGTWVWDSGEPVTYTAWAPGEPKDNVGNEDYGTIRLNPWFAGKADRFLPAMIEVIGEKPPPTSSFKPVQQWFKSPESEFWYGRTVASSDFTTITNFVSAIGTPATIHNAAEDAWIVSVMGEPGIIQLWLGLNDEAVEGQYEWMDGTPVTYTNWGQGEPDDLGGQDNVALMATQSVWKTFAGSLRAPVLVQRFSPPWIEDVGTGCPGSNGETPQVMMTGAPVAGTTMTLHITGGLGNSAAFVMLSDDKGQKLLAPGCFLYLSTPIYPAILGPIGLGASGSVTVFALMPQTLSPGTRFALQAFIDDPDSINGFSMTGALLVEAQESYPP